MKPQKKKKPQSPSLNQEVPTKENDAAFQVQVDKFLAEEIPTSLPSGFTVAETYDPSADSDRKYAVTSAEQAITEPPVSDPALEDAVKPPELRQEAPNPPIETRDKERNYDVLQVRQLIDPRTAYTSVVLVPDSSHRTREQAYKRAISLASEGKNRKVLVVRVLDNLRVSETVVRKVERL